MASFDVEKARLAGYSDQEIQSFMAQNNLVPKFSAGGFAGNVGKSAVKFGSDILSAPKNIFNLGKGLITGKTTLGETGSGLVQGLKDRYGGWDEIARTAYFDPVGTLADVSAVTGAVGGVAKLGKAGEVANTLSKVSRATDPLSIAGKATRTIAKPATNLFSKKNVSGFLDDFSAGLAKKALRPSSSQQRDFLEATGMDVGEYARNMDIQGSGSVGSTKIQPIIKSLKTKYNSLARSGKQVDPTSFINELRKSADDIVAKDFSAEAQQVAQNIRNRADLIETNAIDYMIKNKSTSIPIDIITETKASAFGKVPKGTMADPTIMHGGKTAGGIGIAQVEKFAPGTQKLGKAQQAALMYSDIAKQQAGLGKGTQLINLLKPSGSGAVLGGVLGGALGAFIGGAANIAINSPPVLAGASKVLRKGAEITRDAKLPSMGRVGQVGSSAYNVAKYSRPITQGSQQQVAQPPKPELPKPQLKPAYKPIITPPVQQTRSSLPTSESFYEEIRKKRGY